MPFDVKRFVREKWQPREEDVPVPDLKDFFDENETPVWRVRSLTGRELGQAGEAWDRNKNMAAILEGLVSRVDKEKLEAIRKLAGIGEVPKDVAKRIEMLVLGSIEPKCDVELAKRLCKAFPVEFYQLTNKITELTGKGHIPGKQKPSGATQESGQDLPSATSEGGSSSK